MRFIASTLLLVSLIVPALAQDPLAILVKSFQTSRDFTLQVAEAMPAESYDFKLTPAQMSFGEQMTHIAQAQDFFLSYLSGEKQSKDKPASKSKADVIAFLKASLDKSVARLQAVTLDQLHTTYKTGEGDLTGIQLVLGCLDHTTHHRASAEMYLRAKGITPPEYRF